MLNHFKRNNSFLTNQPLLFKNDSNNVKKMNVPFCCCVLFRYVFRAKSACHHIQKWWRALLSGNKERSVLELKRAAIAKHAMLAFEKKERFLISLKTRRSKETNRMNNNKYKQFLRVSERNILLWNYCGIEIHSNADLFERVFSTLLSQVAASNNSTDNEKSVVCRHSMPHLDDRDTHTLGGTEGGGGVSCFGVQSLFFFSYFMFSDLFLFSILIF